MAEDNFTKESVEKQAAAVRDYWKRRGYAVRTDVLPLERDQGLSGKKKLTGWRLQTDMVNGLPPELCRQRSFVIVKGGRRV